MSVSLLNSIDLHSFYILHLHTSFIFLLLYKYITIVASDYLNMVLHMQTIIRDLYSNFRTSIVTNLFRTTFIKVGRGVLQGDCLSPLIFNIRFCGSFLRTGGSNSWRSIHKTLTAILSDSSLKMYFTRSYD